MRLRPMLLAGFATTLLAGGGVAAVTLGTEPSDAATPPRVEASIAGWRWAPEERSWPKAQAPEAAAEPQSAPPTGQPAEDADTGADTTAEDAVAAQSGRDAPKPADLTVDATGGATDDVLAKAEVLKNGVALPPLEAPAEIRAIFEAGNTIARTPYKWGGGHGRWQDSGYDCSGSVSYALAAAGLIGGSQTSGQLMSYGKPGKGKWITIYANAGHVWMVVAGVRFDTVARGQTGSRWINDMTDTSGYVARHPAGF